MTLDFQRISAVVRQMASIASVVIGSLGTGGIPTSVRTVLVAAGGTLLAAEHFVSAITTSSTPTTTKGTTSG